MLWIFRYKPVLDEILSISYREEDKKQQKENNNKGYVNNGWKFMTKKNINV